MKNIIKKLITLNPIDISDNGNIVFERRFILPVSMAGALLSLFSIIVNASLRLDYNLQLLAYVAFFLYLLIFILTWKNKLITFSKFFIIIMTMIFINFLWYYNNGANGPSLYLFVLLFSFLIFMFNGKSLLILSVVIILNIASLFYVEYNNPDLVADYTSHTQQVYDVYLSVIFFGVLVFIMMYVAKNSFFMAYIEAKNSDKLKTSFLENISHEIRTPLNAIVGFSNLLTTDNPDKETKDQYVESIRKSNKSLQSLVNEILDVSLLENNEMKLIEDTVNLNGFLEKIYSKYREKLQNEKPEIELLVIKPGNDLYAVIDEKRLRQVFNNLLDNAIKFTYHGKITFGVKETEKHLLFFVKDTGIGIDTKYHKLLFDRFYKIDDKSDVLYRGTGIGLYFCKKIIDLMKGKIWVESEVGKGARFYFLIPKKEV